MKTFFGFALGILLLWSGGCIGLRVFADYQFENEIGGYWSLSVKASTLAQKAEYLDKFVAALDHGNLAANDALLLKTPDTSTAENLKAIRSLQTRMHEIAGMDVTSFEYQQAISQITAQEQDDAGAVLHRLEGAWFLNNHFLFWDWIGVCSAIFLIVLIVACFIGIGMFWDD